MLTRLCLSVPRDPPAAGSSQSEEVETQRRQPCKYPELVGMKLGNAVAYNGDQIPTDDLPLLFASHMWYKDGSRFLIRDEVTLIQDHIYNAESFINHELLDRFDNPQDSLTMALQALRTRYGDILCGQVYGLMKRVRAKDEAQKIENISKDCEC